MSTGQPWYKILYVQVLIGIVLGVLLGWLAPESPRTSGSRCSAGPSSS